MFYSYRKFNDNNKNKRPFLLIILLAFLIAWVIIGIRGVEVAPKRVIDNVLIKN